MSHGDMQITMIDPRTNEEWGFAPMRDIAYFHHQLVETIAVGLKKERWEPWLKEYLDFAGVTEDDVLRAYRAYCRFCAYAVDPNRIELKTPGETLEAAGFFDCPKGAQLAVIAKIGQVSTGAWWAGIKSATRLGRIPATIEQLKRYADEAELVLNTRWSQRDEQQSPQMSQQAGAPDQPVPSSPSPP